MPESIVQTVLRTQQSMILHDAAAKNPFSADPYIRKRARSVLCLPLINQSKLIGVLYLENNLASHVFTPARISVLGLVASQAAISLENTRLYGELIVNEQRWRQLFEKVPVGVVLTVLPTIRRGEPGISENDRLFRGRTASPSPTDITHEDDRPATEAIIAAHATGEPYDGTSRSVTGAKMAALGGWRLASFWRLLRAAQTSLAGSWSMLPNASAPKRR